MCPEDTTPEQWRPVNYGGRKLQRGRLLKPDLNWAYPKVSLCRNPGRRRATVHELVLLAFVGPRPPGEECRHLDGCRANNHLSNLRWGTRLENAADKTRHGVMAKGSGHGMAKLTETEVREIRIRHAKGETQTALAEVFGLSRGHVSDLVNRKTWAWLDPD